ncbi:MAG TPA: hypothetical protein VHB21_20500 [Minicystis sp.]|nr:hypothetical protein [Minicystis sp.]
MTGTTMLLVFVGAMLASLLRANVRDHRAAKSLGVTAARRLLEELARARGAAPPVQQDGEVVEIGVGGRDEHVAYAVAIRVDANGSGWTRVVATPAAPIAFALSIQRLGHGRWSGFDVEPEALARTGDARFDTAFLVRASSEAAARAFLSDDVRARLVALRDAGLIELDVGAQGVALSAVGVPRDAERLGAMLDVALLASRSQGAAAYR